MTDEKTSFYREIIHSTLKNLDLWSPAAENLLLGTVAVESDFGVHLTQFANGPALGPYQIEPMTHKDVWRNYLNTRETLADKVRLFCCTKKPAIPPDEKLIRNRQYATAIARIIYLRAPEKLPEANDIDGLAYYWKKYYNTAFGKGDVETFKRKIERALCLTN